MGDVGAGSGVPGDGEENRLGTRQRSLGSATGTCSAGGSATKKRVTTDCSTRRAVETAAACGDGGELFALYPEKYFDLNVQHFHEKLQAEHGIEHGPPTTLSSDAPFSAESSCSPVGNGLGTHPWQRPTTFVSMAMSSMI